jgi:dienelactone hydrolase
MESGARARSKIEDVLKQWYADRMYAWETRLTNEDSNRVVRPVEWGFDWLADWDPLAARLAQRFPEEEEREPGGSGLGESGFGEARFPRVAGGNSDLPALSAGDAEAAMLAINDDIARRSEEFFGYKRPVDYVLEERHPQLYPTNVRPETLKKDAAWKQMAEDGTSEKAKFLRFTSPVKTKYEENDRVNARWFEAPAEKRRGKPQAAMIVMPQWNADAFSHNILCEIFNKFGVSALRLSKPFHDVRRPSHLERSDYAVSSNIGRTIASARQAVTDIRACIDWLETQGYEQFGILGTSLGSCYAFLASAHDARIRVNAFNHASTWYGDVVWQGQSTRHIREGFEQAGFLGEAGKERVRALWRSISPPQYIVPFAAKPKHVRVIYANYDLTFPRELSLDVLKGFREHGIHFDSKALPCGHYTTGETPYKYLDGWWLGSYVYQAFKRLREDPSSDAPTAAAVEAERVYAGERAGKNAEQRQEPELVER